MGGWTHTMSAQDLLMVLLSGILPAVAPGNVCGFWDWRMVDCKANALPTIKCFGPLFIFYCNNKSVIFLLDLESMIYLNFKFKCS